MNLYDAKLIKDEKCFATWIGIFYGILISFVGVLAGVWVGSL